MTILLAVFCSMLGVWSKINSLHSRALWMIALSGVAGAASWVFYFKAIQVGTVSQVAPIDKLSMPLTVILATLLLGDRPTLTNWVGVGCIVLGGYLASLPRG
jgi:transporter family protein